MRLLHLLPYAALILLAEAAVGSVPDIVAAREGGMGLGSALIVGQLAQVAGTALGAVVAAHVVGRWSTSVALVAGAVLFYAGLIGVGHQPSHLLGWIVVVLTVAGAGLGMLLTASFAAAADARSHDRPYAVAVLLLASLAAAQLVDNPAFLLGPPALVIVAAVIAAGTLAIARFSMPAAQVTDRAGLTMGAALAGGGLLGVGVAAILWGLEPSGVSALLVGQSLGITGIESLGTFRLALVLFGLAAFVAGAVVVLTRSRPARSTVIAAAGSGAAAFAAAGLFAIAGFAMPGVPPSRFGGTLGELTTLAIGAGGLLAGGWLLARGTSHRTLALAGAALLVGVAFLVLFGGGWLLPSSGAAVPLLALAATAGGAALLATALRALLAEVSTGERGAAAAAGVAAAAFGAMAGLLVGAGEGIRLAVAGEDAVGLAALALGGSALVTLGLTALVPASPPAELSDAAPERAYSD